MALVLYDNPVSANAMKVRMLLAELNEPYERRRVPLARPRPAGFAESLPCESLHAASPQAITTYCRPFQT